MGQTLGGLPWPENTDPLLAGAAAIRALAESVDRLYFHAERVAAYSIGGGGTDVNVGGGTAAWELIDSNFIPPTIPGPASFTLPAAGLWMFSANTCLSGTLTAVRVTCFIIASGGKEVGTQNLETGGGNVFRTINANGAIRCAAGEIVRMTVSQNSGGALNFGGGAAPGTRFTTRFTGYRMAP